MTINLFNSYFLDDFKGKKRGALDIKKLMVHWELFQFTFTTNNKFPDTKHVYLSKGDHHYSTLVHTFKIKIVYNYGINKTILTNDFKVFWKYVVELCLFEK